MNKLTHIIVLLILVATFSCTSNQEVSNVKPNIIFILADDLGYGDLSCYGQEKFETPNIDQLASEGMKFTSFYAGSTVCAPSRNTLLCGQHTGVCTVRGNGYGDQRIPLSKNDTTIAMLLKNHGYATAAIGKWGLGEAHSEGTPNDKGFDYWFGFLNQKKAHYYYPDSIWENNTLTAVPKNMDGKRGANIHDCFTDKSLNFISENKENPFFLYLAYTVPHAELVAKPDILEMYKGRYEEVPFNGSTSYPRNHFPRATYAAMIHQLDTDVGKISEFLDDLGLSENTILIFASDNGPEARGKHGCDPEYFNSTGTLRGVKRSLYEGGLRVPFIAKWENHIKPGECDHPLALWDVLPTLCDLSHTPVPENISGASFASTLLNPDHAPKPRTQFWEFHRNAHPSVMALRDKNWKAIYNYGTNQLELYNLDSDPKETTNLASTEIEIANRLKYQMATQHQTSPYWKLSASLSFKEQNDLIEKLDTPFPMKELQRPAIPGTSYSILDFGAELSSGFRIDSALELAINEAVKNGGGSVIIPSGKWECGPIHLESNINLHLEKGAYVKFSNDLSDYLPAVFSRHQGIECYKFSPLIYANNKENIAITGEGVFHGQGKAWWRYNDRRVPAWKKLEQMVLDNIPLEERVFADTLGNFLAPSFVQPINCKNLLIEGPIFLYGPFWTVNPVYCENVIIRRVTIITEGEYGHTKNGDGINPSSCKNVLIEYCDLNTGDDCITIKSGRAEDGLRVNIPSENIIVRHCNTKKGHGGIVIGSETSGGIHNIYIHSCNFSGTDRGIRLKTARGRGAAIKNIYIKNINMKEIVHEGIIVNMLRYTPRLPAHKVTERTPEYDNIHIENVTCIGAETGISLIGLPEHAMKNIHLKNITLDANIGLHATDAEHVILDNIKIHADSIFAASITNCKNVALFNVNIQDTKLIRLREINRNLRFENCNFTDRTDWLINDQTAMEEIIIIK